MKNSLALPNDDALESLEARIAPAVFMFSEGTIVGPDGSDATTAHQGEADMVGASKAVLLAKGDSLVIDSDNNGIFDKATDTVIAQIKGGSSLVFFTDSDESGGIDENEISGLAVSNKFGGVLNADVHGDVATLLSGPDATLSVNQLASDASISKLTINGYVERSILASSSISGLTITGARDGSSVSGIYTGDAIGEEFTARMGAQEFYLYISPAETAAKSTSISKLTIDGGAQAIIAGSGEGKPGGSISSVTIKSLASSLEIHAGDAQSGNGGSLSGISIVNSVAGVDVALAAGDGALAKKAGAGGSISKISISGEKLGTLVFAGGDGSDGSEDGEGSASGGAGGSVKMISVISGATSLSAHGGRGGQGAYQYFYKPSSNPYGYGRTIIKGGAGGAGGEVSGLVVSELGVESLTVLSGSGGDGMFKAKPGSAGKIASIEALLADSAVVEITSGNGGNAQKSAAAGGAISGLSLIGDMISEITITGGDGGSSTGAEKFVGKGGAGGSISKISVLASTESGDLGALRVRAGNGGNASYASFSPNPYAYYPTYKYLGASGGAGGSIKAVVVSNLVAETLEVTGGAGGESTFKFNAPNGGGVSGVVATVVSMEGVSLTGGAAGTPGPIEPAKEGLDGPVTGNTITVA